MRLRTNSEELPLNLASTTGADMKVIFTFENGTSRMTLSPENRRDKSLLELLYPPGEQVTCKVSSPGDKGVLALEVTTAREEPVVPDAES